MTEAQWIRKAACAPPIRRPKADAFGFGCVAWALAAAMKPKGAPQKVGPYRTADDMERYRAGAREALQNFKII